MQNVLWLLLLALMWSPSFLFIKIGLRGFPPLTLATVRLLLGAAILYGVLRSRGRTLPRTWAVWRKFLVMGFFANAFPFAMFSLGEMYADSGMAAILNGTTPIFTVLLAHFLIADEPLTARKFWGVSIGFAGIVFLFLPGIGSAPLRGAALWGLIAFMLAALSYGIGIVYARRNLRGLPPLVAPTTQLLVGGLYLLPTALVFERPFHLSPGLASLGAVLALAFFGTAVAFVLFYHLIERTSATFLSLVTYILPPAGVALGIVFLNEQPGWNALIGCVLIVVGVMVVNGVFAGLWKRWAHPVVA